MPRDWRGNPLPPLPLRAGGRGTEEMTQVKVRIAENRVIVDMARPLAYLALNPDQARALASAILTCADHIAPASSIILPPGS